MKIMGQHKKGDPYGIGMGDRDISSVSREWELQPYATGAERSTNL